MIVVSPMALAEKKSELNERNACNYSRVLNDLGYQRNFQVCQILVQAINTVTLGIRTNHKVAIKFGNGETAKTEARMTNGSADDAIKTAEELSNSAKEFQAMIVRSLERHQLQLLNALERSARILRMKPSQAELEKLRNYEIIVRQSQQELNKLSRWANEAEQNLFYAVAEAKRSEAGLLGMRQLNQDNLNRLKNY